MPCRELSKPSGIYTHGYTGHRRQNKDGKRIAI